VHETRELQYWRVDFRTNVGLSTVVYVPGFDECDAIHNAVTKALKRNMVKQPFDPVRVFITNTTPGLYEAITSGEN
jgi:hypothetical protein